MPEFEPNDDFVSVGYRPSSSFGLCIVSATVEADVMEVMTEALSEPRLARPKPPNSEVTLRLEGDR